MSQLPFGWVCFSNRHDSVRVGAIPCLPSKLPFGWVCFYNKPRQARAACTSCSLNCLSAGSVSLTRYLTPRTSFCGHCWGLNCLSAGSVSLTRYKRAGLLAAVWASQLPFGWVCFSNTILFGPPDLAALRKSQLPFGWVCFSNNPDLSALRKGDLRVSIAFRLGLFL